MNRYILFLTIFFSFSSFGWNSGDEKNPGPEQALLVLSPDQSGSINEHAKLMLRSFKLAGVDEDLVNIIFPIDVYVDSSISKVSPEDFMLVDDKVTREVNISGFASLPDHSFSIWDWLSGNESCPRGTEDGVLSVFPSLCHNLYGHLGFTNSHHFVPQAGYTFLWYHKLALESAKECGVIKSKLEENSLYAENEEYVKKIIKECEIRTYMYEAFGQHFLQDTWAVGHMWERWGAPDIATFESKPRALLVAATAGLLHGRSEKDLMTSGLDKAFVPFASSASIGGVGDHGYSLLITSPLYSQQLSKLDECSMASIAEVKFYLEGAVGPVKPYSFDPSCLAQRNTNLAIEKGWGITGFALDSVILGVILYKSDFGLASEWRADYINAYVRILIENRIYKDKLDSTELSTTKLPSILGVKRNSLAISSPAGAPPAPFSDPSTMDSLSTPSNIEIFQSDSVDSAAVMIRGLNRAHITPLCADPEVNPEKLRERVTKLRESADPALPIACSVCTEFSSRHIEVDGNKSMCEIIGAEGPTIKNFESKLIPSPLSIGLSQVERAATEWCGCQVVGATLKVQDPTYGNFKANVSGLSSEMNPILFSIKGSPGNTCGGEMGGPVYSSKVYEEGSGTALLYPATLTSGVADRFSATANRRTCSSFVATSNLGTENERLWINVSERSWRNNAGFISDREYQLRFYTGEPENREGTKRCEIGWANVPFGNYFGTPLGKCDYELIYDGLPVALPPVPVVLP
jgi:hypothetical protein